MFFVTKGDTRAPGAPPLDLPQHNFRFYILTCMNSIIVCGADAESFFINLLSYATVLKPKATTINSINHNLSSILLNIS